MNRWTSAACVGAIVLATAGCGSDANVQTSAEATFTYQSPKDASKNVTARGTANITNHVLAVTSYTITMVEKGVTITTYVPPGGKDLDNNHVIDAIQATLTCRQGTMTVTRNKNNTLDITQGDACGMVPTFADARKVLAEIEDTIYSAAQSSLKY